MGILLSFCQNVLHKWNESLKSTLSLQESFHIVMQTMQGFISPKGNLSIWLFSTTLSIALRLKLHYVRNTFIYRVLFNEIFHNYCRLMNHKSLSILRMRCKNFMSRNACVKMCFLHYTRRETKLTIFTKKLVSYTYFFPPLQ